MLMDSNTKPLKNSSPPSPLKFYELLGFVGILREAPKLFLRNGKLMSSIAILMICLSSVLLLMNIISIKPSITDFIFKASFLTLTDKNSPEFADLITSLKIDLRLVVGLEGIFILAFSFTSLFFATSSILASGVTYCGKNLSVRELLSRVVKLLKRPFVTWFYLMLLHLGYCLFLTAFLVPLVVLFSPKFTLSGFSIIVLIVAVLFQAYLTVVWNLALIVSVLEEKWGIEALGKAEQLIKGSKLRGLFMNILFGAFSVAVVYGLKKIGNIAFSGSQIVIPLLLLNSMSLIRMFSLMAYTVLYYECKETHGEELEMQGGVEYTKVTAVTPLLSSDEEC
ncbi:uncharacterized protein LOC133712506 [Rosa rugosa]|uniref:uncharacterized protein LOC133712506 n=1 Tax=Rosa rugosa TaxID=74645 RepID=UPI002B403579|nr:uncharacterized protein LOC133712506 [Rosa rugosa]